MTPTNCGLHGSTILKFEPEVRIGHGLEAGVRTKHEGAMVDAYGGVVENARTISIEIRSVVGLKRLRSD